MVGDSRTGVTQKYDGPYFMIRWLLRQPFVAVLPVAVGVSEGGESRAPMAVAVIGGMLTSTFLTLLVIPVVYLLLDDFASWLRRLFRGPATAVDSARGSEEAQS